MKLAIECSTSKGGVALSDDRLQLLDEKRWEDRASHSKNLLSAIDQVLRANTLRVQDIDELCLSGGPGSFTALRIAFAVTKTFAHFLGLPILVFSSLEVMASRAQDVAKESGNERIVPMLTARRGEVFGAVFRCDHAALEREHEDSAFALDALMETIGRSRGHALLLGDGYQANRDFFLKKGGVVYRDGAHNDPSAAEIFALYRSGHYRKFEGEELFRLAPSYCRASAAELKWGC